MRRTFLFVLQPQCVHHSSPRLSGSTRIALAAQEVYDYLRSICADVHVTKGDFDDQKGYPEDEVLSIGDFRIGLCNGHQVCP